MSGTTYPPSVVTPAEFRIDYPEFADITIYPDQRVQSYLSMGTVVCGSRSWGAYQRLGCELWTAHMLSLGRRSTLQASGGGVPGSGIGVMSSKSVSKVSVSYDNQLTMMEGGGPWNYTLYGQQFLWWAQILGTGGYETLAAASPYMAGWPIGEGAGVYYQGV